MEPLPVTSLISRYSTLPPAQRVVCGLWSVVCGLWSMVCGLWSVVCGTWSVAWFVLRLSICSIKTGISQVAVAGGALGSCEL